MSTEQEREEYQRIIRSFRLAAIATLAVIGAGGVFYHIVEKLSWVDTFYFAVVTLGTVGYGDIVPKTDAGKIFTTFYILVGIGIIATFANLALKRAMVHHRMKEDAKRESHQ